MKDTFKPFWMVIVKPMKNKPDTQNRGSRYKHYTRKAAEVEAKRLSDMTGNSFLVMKTVKRFNPTKTDSDS